MNNRTFGFCFSAFLGTFALINWLLTETLPTTLISSALCFFVVSLVWPSLMLPLNRSWQWFGLKLGLVMNTLVLGLFYFMIVFPIGFLMKLTGSDPMQKKSHINGISYWTPVDRKANPETYIDTF
jgi:hypothetical protein